MAEIRDPENTLLIELKDGGQVAIEMLPDVAPRHVERIKALARLLGRRTEELAGRALRDLVHPDDTDEHDQLAQRLDDGQIDGFTLELRLAHA